MGDVGGDYLQEGEVGGGLEPEDVRVEQHRQEDCVEDQKESVDHGFDLESA